ncbi:uncharacterized protein BDR25DRAFT_245431, partial [Lindgomyces ingoldianus]
SALGIGVDYPRVVYILHVGMLWSIIDFAQESRRGGRAREEVNLVIVVERRSVEQEMLKHSDNLCVQAIGLFLTGRGCRRALMSMYMDSKAVACNNIKSARCD